jgi:hypothetical protein
MELSVLLIVIGTIEVIVALLLVSAASSWPERDGTIYQLHAGRAAAAPPHAAARRPRLADGCEHVYLDVGTNIGVQIRKLFEPAHYPRAAVLPVFDAVFGAADRRRTVCAFGWEPNPSNTARLRDVQSAYARKGWRTTIHTETAAGVREGVLTFYWSGDAWRDLAASAIVSPHLTATKRATPLHRSQVRAMDLARFINEEVHARLRPPNATAGRVVMKLDVEGSELDLLPDLLLRGALCEVDTLYLELHARHFLAGPSAVRQRYAALVQFVKTGLQAGRQASKALDTDCALKVSELDDETYMLDQGFSGLKQDRWMRLNLTAARTAGFAMAQPPLP